MEKKFSLWEIGLTGLAILLTILIGLVLFQNLLSAV